MQLQLYKNVPGIALYNFLSQKKFRRVAADEFSQFNNFTCSSAVYNTMQPRSNAREYACAMHQHMLIVCHASYTDAINDYKHSLMFNYSLFVPSD